MIENVPEKPQSMQASGDPNAASNDFSSGLVFEVEPWYKTLVQNVRDLLHPPKLPPLQLTSKPVAVKEMWGDYRYGKVARPTSIAIHAIILALLLIPVGNEVVQVVRKEVIFTPVDLSPYTAQLPPDEQKVQGGGGGGDRSPDPASLGKLPKLSMQQLAPPAVVVRNPNPRLAVEPTVVVPPQITLPSVAINRMGDPLGTLGMPSSGPGFGGGIGSGSGGGVGSGDGPGVGPGRGGGIGGGVFRVGGGVSAPTVVFKVDPEYSEQARKAKYQGTVVLNLVVQRDGSVRDIKILRPLGLGLDEKAIEAVQQWRFKPGQRNGLAVDVSAIIEVTFRLL
jgi:TonB family protein